MGWLNCYKERMMYQGRYEVPYAEHPLHICTEVPGSKSMTNRALLLAAMAKGTSVLDGVLYSEDSLVFLKALEDLGFPVENDQIRHRVFVTGMGGEIPKKRAEIFVGSAGTAARFLTAFLALSGGTYHLDATEQMKKRPMRELLSALETLGVDFLYEEEAYHFPFSIQGYQPKTGPAEVSLNIDRSSQFLSALLLVAPSKLSSLRIHLTGQRSAKSYVTMTEQMMREFGHSGVQNLTEQDYLVEKQEYRAREYEIEPDVSAACYFYAMAAVTGGSAVVKRMKRDSLQGDRKFLSVLEKMGCTLVWKKREAKEELYLYAPEGKSLHGFEECFSDFSDQALTAAAIAPFADSPVIMKGLSHIRGQESDRMAVMEQELSRMGVPCEVKEDQITIFPKQPQAAEIHTYKDHRVAMAFAITGLRTRGLVILEPECCKKTFPEYFMVFHQLLH